MHTTNSDLIVFEDYCIEGIIIDSDGPVTLYVKCPSSDGKTYCLFAESHLQYYELLGVPKHKTKEEAIYTKEFLSNFPDGPEYLDVVDLLSEGIQIGGLSVLAYRPLNPKPGDKDYETTYIIERVFRNYGSLN